MNDTIEIRTEEKKDRGFTLIELLIVIVILGILATVTVFAVGGISNRGQTSACAAEKKTIEVALEAHMAQLGVYPADLAVMTSGATKFLNAPPTKYTYTAGTAPATTYTLGPATGSGCT